MQDSSKFVYVLFLHDCALASIINKYKKNNNKILIFLIEKEV